MNQPIAGSVAERAERQSFPCCIVTVRNLLDGVRRRHRLEQFNSLRTDAPDNVEPELPSPSLHDVLAGELEASLRADGAAALPAPELEIRHDVPAELSRARRVFALSWLLPLLLVSATLAVRGDTFGRGLHALLQFSMLVMAVPLAGSLAALLLRIFQRRRKLSLAAASANTSRLE